MNLRHLRTFIAIVDAGGVARAAARLHMTQPTASRQVEALESEFGVPLFDRIGRRVRLTSEGEDLLLRGRRLLAEADAMDERARALKAGDTGLLRIGATPQAIESLLIDFLAGYRLRHPGVEIRLIALGERHLRQVTPLIGQRSRPVQRLGRVVSHALVGGLHHQYVRI